MKRLFLFLLIFGCFLSAPAAQEELPLRFNSRIPLSGDSGRLEHLGIDRNTQRLFVASYGNNSVEVIDLKEQQFLQSLSGFAEPEDILYVPETGKLYVTNDDDGTLRIIDGTNYGEITSFDFGYSAALIRYDQVNKRMYVGYGYGSIAVIDGVTNKLLSTINFTGQPSAFEIDRTGKRIYINTPSANRIVMADLVTLSPVGIIILRHAQNNFAMTFDETGRRLFVGCRNPGQMLIYDCDSGREVTTIPIDDGVNDMFYDEGNKRIYLSCGSGAIDIVSQLSPDDYVLQGAVATANGASTSLFLPEKKRFYVAVPDYTNPLCEVWVYDIVP
jgi:DNA-binding beta-propeller fold protein YncE